MTEQHPLITFLRARYDEAEQVARDAAETGEHWRYQRIPDLTAPDGYSLDLGDVVDVIVDIGFAEDDVLRPAQAAHIALHDPASVLADIAAKRKILDALAPDIEAFSGEVAQADAAERMANWLRAVAVVRLLAEPYASHPDYREEWRP
ncbi:DUF6221 family protein [Microbispora bryophytorum]|uniref:DUF6221 family protein n=1 Tax=Microbispora bryophytorum TaxID=1460882 RepID=UPI0033F0BED2